MKNKIRARLASNRADSNTVSIILWIAVTVLIVLTVGSVIYKAVVEKGDAVADNLNNAETIVQGGSGNTGGNTGG